MLSCCSPCSKQGLAWSGAGVFMTEEETDVDLSVEELLECSALLLLLLLFLLCDSPTLLLPLLYGDTYKLAYMI